MARRWAIRRRRTRLSRDCRADDPANRPLPPPGPADLTSHAGGFAFLTGVAATNVLGVASGVIHGWWGFAWALWFVGIALWVVPLYITLIAVVLAAPNPASKRASTAPGSCLRLPPSRLRCWARCCLR